MRCPNYFNFRINCICLLFLNVASAVMSKWAKPQESAWEIVSSLFFLLWMKKEWVLPACGTRSAVSTGEHLGVSNVKPLERGGGVRKVSHLGSAEPPCVIPAAHAQCSLGCEAKRTMEFAFWRKGKHGEVGVWPAGSSEWVSMSKVSVMKKPGTVWTNQTHSGAKANAVVQPRPVWRSPI